MYLSFLLMYSEYLKSSSVKDTVEYIARETVLNGLDLSMSSRRPSFSELVWNAVELIK